MDIDINNSEIRIGSNYQNSNINNNNLSPPTEY